MRESIQVNQSARLIEEIIMPGMLNDYKICFKELILLNEAYAVMLADRGILKREHAGKIIEGLKYVEKTLKPEDLNGEWEDIYFNMERNMFKRVGSEIGGRLHCGRSRNDINATVQRMEIRKTVWDVLDELVSFQKLLLEKAEENKDAVMTGYTHWQPGQPITLGYYYMCIFNALSRDFDRIKNAYENLNQSPYGAAAFAGTGFDIDRQQLSDLLGFDSVMENCMDCIGSRDYVYDLLSAYSSLAINLSRMAEDMYFWATFENGILELGGEIANCSSIMPQKRNPTTLEYTKGKTGHIIGQLMDALVAVKAAPYTNNMDIYEAPAAYFTSLTPLHHIMVSISESVKYTSLRKDVAIRKAGENLCTVTSLADHWVKTEGLSFTQAHDIVGNIVSIIIANSKLIAGITPELVAAESEKSLGRPIIMTAEELRSVLDPYENVQSKPAFGGPSIVCMDHMLDKAAEQMNKEELWVNGIKAKVTAAYEELDRQAAILEKENV